MVSRAGLDNGGRVLFPPDLLSLPQRLEYLMAAQQRRLDYSVVDTSARATPPEHNNNHLDANG